MKFIVIVLLIAVCTQDVLCARNPRQPRRSRTKAVRKALAKDDTIAKKPQPTTEERASNDASGCTLTIDGAPLVEDAPPVSEIPVISMVKEMKITGEDNEISVDGKVLYNKNQVGRDFTEGTLRIKLVNGRCVYLNEKLVARNLDDENLLPSKSHRAYDVSVFHLKIKLGEYVKMIADVKEANFFWRFPPPKTTAADTSKCSLVLDGYSPAEYASPVSEIPVLSSDKETAITCEKGKIRVDGVVLYNEEDFKKKDMRFKMTEKKCVYLNEKLVARSVNDDIHFPTISSNRKGIKKFDVRIKLGDYVKMGVDGAEPRTYVTWNQPEPISTA